MLGLCATDRASTPNQGGSFPRYAEITSALADGSPVVESDGGRTGGAVRNGIVVAQSLLDPSLALPRGYLARTR